MSLLHKEMCVERPWGSQKLPDLQGPLLRWPLAAVAPCGGGPLPHSSAAGAFPLHRNIPVGFGHSL